MKQKNKLFSQPINIFINVKFYSLFKLDSQFFSIAGFIVKLQPECSADIVLEEGYLPFAFTDHSAKPDILIKAHKGIPKGLLNKTDILFEAKNQLQDFFSIYRHGNSFKFFIYDQLNINSIQQVAILNNDYSEWEIYSEPHDSDKINPLLYPLGPLVLYYLTAKFDAIMLHSSGIFDGIKGRIFSGFSGVGKSTMAGLWMQTGSTVINDDRLIIRKKGDHYVMYNTPMYYVDIPKEAPLQSIYLISHAQENTIKKLSGAASVSRLMAYCIQHGYNKRLIHHHLEFLSQLCNIVTIYDVGFKPDIQIVDFIKKYGD